MVSTGYGLSSGVAVAADGGWGPLVGVACPPPVDVGVGVGVVVAVLSGDKVAVGTAVSPLVVAVAAVVAMPEMVGVAVVVS